MTHHHLPSCPNDHQTTVIEPRAMGSMKQKSLFAFILTLALWANNAYAYEVWLGTHKWEGAAADNLDEWDQAIDKIDGINYVLLDARPARPAGDGANTSDWNTMIGRIDQSVPGMAEIARSQYLPAKNVSLASRMQNEFATVENRGGVIDIIMLYDEERDGTVYEFTLEDVQAVRDWLDNNGESHVTLCFNLRNNDQERLGLAQQPIIDSVLIEASATRWVENRFNLHTLLQSLRTHPSTRDKDIHFQIPRSESPGSAGQRNGFPTSPINQYIETRRALQVIRNLAGDEFMRSDQAIFVVCNYGDTYPTYPETNASGTNYVDSKSGLALSLIEQRSLFEGRTRAPTSADAESTTRLFAPTVSGIEDQILSAGASTGGLAFTVADDATAASALTVTGTSSNITLVPNANIVLGGSGANRTVTVTPAAGQSGSADIELWVSDGTLATPIRFTVTVLPPGVVAGTLFSNAADCSITEAPAIERLTSPTVDLGARGSSPWVERCTVYVFQLPNLGMVANPFTEASFTFNYVEKTGTLRGNDLYGLGRRTAPTVLTTDFYSQSPTADPTDATRLQQTILSNSTPTGPVSTSAGGNANLVNYLNAQYAGGAGAGQYVFLRINTRDTKSGVSSATLTMSEGGAAGPPDTRPRLTYQAMGDSPPVLSGIDDQTIDADSSTGPLAFTVSDDSTPVDSITLTKDSSNTGLVPVSHIVFGGGGANRTVTVTPVAGQGGSAVISIIADDGSLTTTRTFTLTVRPPGTVTGSIFSDVADSAPRQVDGQAPSILTSTAMDANLYAGRGGSGSTVDRCVVFPFLLPSLGTIQNPFTEALLTFNLESNTFSPADCNLDLYGLGSRPSATVLASDYYSETNTPDPTPGVTKLQEEICMPGTSPSLVTSGSTGNTALLAYLNTQYAGGANAGKFVFLRLSKDAITDTAARRYTVTSADGAAVANGGSPDLAIWPQITFTATAGNDAPTISNITDRSIAVNTGTGALPFTIGDAQTAPGSLVLSKASSNPVLVPTANIVLGGTGENRTVTVTPVANRIGSVVITLTISDGELTADETFLVTVTGDAQESWRFTHFNSTANSGVGADEFDVNFDGESNLLEFATGQNPHAATRAVKPLEMGGANLVFRYTRSTAALADGVTFTAQWSDTLAPNSWSSLGVTDVLDTANPGTPEVENRIATLPTGTDGKRFVRLGVSRP